MSFTEKLWRRNLQIAEDRGTHTHTHRSPSWWFG